MLWKPSSIIFLTGASVISGASLAHAKIYISVDQVQKILFQGIEILEYREPYGYEVAAPQWREQFVGKTARDPLKLNHDIQNISGATLSSKHITDGVKRVMHFYQVALKIAN